MSGLLGFSPARFGAMVSKEFTQMRRDRVTFGMMVGIPLLQLILFGYAINSDPKNLPTAILDNDRAVDDLVGQHDPCIADDETIVRGFWPRVAILKGIDQHRISSFRLKGDRGCPDDSTPTPCASVHSGGI